MRRRVPAGLRPRLLLAFILTSAATLGVAATVLLSPLQDRLREQSAVNLRGAVQDSVPRFQDALDRATTDDRARADPFALQTAAVELRQRTNGRVLVDDDVCCELLYDTDNGTDTDYARARQATLVAFRALREE